MTTNKSDEICLMVPLSDREARDLARFLKRTGFADFRSQAIDDDEALPNAVGCGKVQKPLGSNWL